MPTFLLIIRIDTTKNGIGDSFRRTEPDLAGSRGDGKTRWPTGPLIPWPPDSGGPTISQEPEMVESLQGKTVLVIGRGSGIARAVVEAAGATVSAGGRDDEKLAGEATSARGRRRRRAGHPSHGPGP
jgi:hypothetical protein